LQLSASIESLALSLIFPPFENFVEFSKFSGENLSHSFISKFTPTRSLKQTRAMILDPCYRIRLRTRAPVAVLARSAVMLPATRCLVAGSINCCDSGRCLVRNRLEMISFFSRLIERKGIWRVIKCKESWARSMRACRSTCTCSTPLRFDA